MIKSIEVSGYRLLNKFTADFDDLTVVIGANATGKSTLVDVLQFVAQSTELPLSTTLQLHGGEFSVFTAGESTDGFSWKIDFHKPIRDQGWEVLPLDRDVRFTYHVELSVDKIGRVKPTYEVLRTSEPFEGHDTPLKYLEVTPYRSKVWDPRKKRLVSFDDALPESQESGTENTGREPTSQARTINEDISLRLSQMRFFNEFPVPSACRSLLRAMAFYPGFNVGFDSALRRSAAEIRATTTLEPDGHNLGTALHEIMTRYDHRDRRDEILDFYRTAYPQFEDLSVETTPGTPPRVLVRVREVGMSRSFEVGELSDGMLRFMCLAVALLNPVPPSFIAVDEPEVGLHPRLLPILADMIKTSSERTQVLVTTHSPELLSHFELDDVAVLTRDGARVNWSRPSSRQSLVKMLKSITGDTLGDLLRTGELEAYG